MTKELRKSLRWWWENRPIKDHTHVFLCLNEHPGQRENYGHPFVSNQNFMRRICQEAGVQHFGFHAIRHLTASILYHQGEPTANIQAILRHRSSKTTEGYLRRIGLERVRDALESLTPKTGSAEIIAFEKMFESVESGGKK